MEENNSKAKILIVEDELLITTDLTARLKSLGYTVCAQATRGEKALALVEQQKPDLVMMDIGLQSEMNGIDAAELICNKWGIPVVFLTTDGDYALLKRAKLTCPFGYLLKPLQNRDLKITTEMTLYMAQVERERTEANRKPREVQNSLDRLMESIQAGIVVHGSNGAVIKSNTAAQVMLGLTREQMFGKELIDSAWTFLREDGSPLPVEEYPVSRVLTTKKPAYNLVVGIQRKDKTEPIWILGTAIPEFGENGRISQIITTFMDISALKKSEAALRESEAKFRNLFENMMHEVHLWKLVRDEHGSIKTWRLVEANPTALKAWGKKRSEIIGKTANEIFSYDTTAHFMSIVKKIFTEGTPQTWETYFPVTNQFLHMTSVPFGEYFISTGTDISDRKQAEDALRASEERFRVIAESSVEILYQLDVNGNISFMSPAFERIYGYPLEEVLNLNYVSFFPESELEKVAELINNALAGEKYQLVEFMAKRKDDSTFPIETSISPIIKDDEIVGVQGITRDISERKQLELEREKLIIELKEALAEIQELRDFLPICAHCKNIRDDEGYWQKIENYITDRTKAQFSHGICPDCLKKHYPELYDEE